MASDNEASCASDPNFAVICSFLECFGKSCGIVYPDIAGLQEMLENTQDVPQQLIDLHIKLLRKTRKTVSPEKWERALVKFCHTYSNQDGWELERFGYKKARIAVKLRLLKVLLETQFDLNQKFKNEVNKVAANELRVEPLGRDKSGLAYWCQLDEECNIRVYREDVDEENWELVAKDREGVVNLISTLSNGEVGPIPINEDSNSLEISEKPIIDTGQITTSPSLEDEALQENGIRIEVSSVKKMEKMKSEDFELEIERHQGSSNEADDDAEEGLEIEDELSNDESSKQNTEEDDSQETIKMEAIESNRVQMPLLVSVSSLKLVNGKVDTLSEKKSVSPQKKEMNTIEETTVTSVASNSKPIETFKSEEHTIVSSSKVNAEELVPLKSIETPVITSPLKLANLSETIQVHEGKETVGIALNATKKSEDSVEQVMKPFDKLPNKNNLPFPSADIPTTHCKLSVKPIDQLAANLVRIQSEKLDKPNTMKSLEKIAENLARSGSIVGNIVNGDDDRLPQDFYARSQTEKTNRGHRGMDLSTSPRGWEGSNEQNKPMDFSGIDLSSRKLNKSIDLPSPGYRTQDFQHREMDLSTKKLNKPEVTNLPYDARAVMMRNHAMVADLSKRQMSFPTYDMSSAPYHNTTRISSKEDHRLPNYTILPDPSKITALRMNTTSVKRPLEGDDMQQDMLKRIRADVIPIRGTMDKRPIIGTNWRDEVGEAIEEPMMMVQGEGSGSDCDAVNPGLGEAVEEPIIFFYGEGSGEECQAGNPNDDTSADNKESNESKNEADSATSSLSLNSTEDSLVNEVSTGSLVANKSNIKLNRNFPQSSDNVKSNCQIVGSTQEKPKFKPTLGIQIIPKNTSSSMKRLSRWDVGKPGEKTECDSSIISNERDISSKKNESECKNFTRRSQDVKVDGNSVNTEDITFQERNVELGSPQKKGTGESSDEQKQSLTVQVSVQCDSSISLCQADTSEALDTCTEATATTRSINEKNIVQNICDSESIVSREKDSLEKIDNECKPVASSPPRFFFGPNCVSYTSKSEVSESQSDQIVSTTIQSKSETLQYECVSSSKPMEDIVSSYKSDDYDVTQTNNNSLKIKSYTPNSDNSHCENDNKSKTENVEGPTTNAWEQTVSSRYSVEEQQCAIPMAEANLSRSESKLNIEENLKSCSTVTTQDPTSSSENTTNECSKPEETEASDAISQPHSTNDLSKDASDAELENVIAAPTVTQCKILDEQLQNEKSDLENDPVNPTETPISCSEDKAECKSSDVCAILKNDETDSVSINNSCTSSFTQSPQLKTEYENNLSESNYPSRPECSTYQEVDSSAEKEMEHVSEKEFDSPAETCSKHSEKNDNFSEFDSQEERSIDTDNENMKNQVGSDADSMCVNYDKNSERIDALTDVGTQDEVSEDSEEMREKTLDDSVIKNSVPDINTELDFADSSTVTSSESIEQYNKDPLVPTISSSDDACIRDTSFHESVKVQLDSEKSPFKNECPMYNVLPEIVPDTNNFKPSKSDTVETTKEINLSNLAQTANEFEDVASEDRSSCADQESNKNMVINNISLESAKLHKHKTSSHESLSHDEDDHDTSLELRSSPSEGNEINSFDVPQTEKTENIANIELNSTDTTMKPTIPEIDDTDRCKDVTDHVEENQEQDLTNNIEDANDSQEENITDKAETEEPKVNRLSPSFRNPQESVNEIKQSLVPNYDSSDSNDGSDDVFEPVETESSRPRNKNTSNLEGTVIINKQTEKDDVEEPTMQSETLSNEIQNTLTNEQQSELSVESNIGKVTNKDAEYRENELTIEETAGQEHNCNIVQRDSNDKSIVSINENKSINSPEDNNIKELTVPSETGPGDAYNSLNKESIDSSLDKANNSIDTENTEEGIKWPGSATEKMESLVSERKDDSKPVGIEHKIRILMQTKEGIEPNDVNNQITRVNLKEQHLKSAEEKLVINLDNDVTCIEPEKMKHVTEELSIVEPYKKLKELSEFSDKQTKFDVSLHKESHLNKELPEVDASIHSVNVLPLKYDNISSGTDKSEICKNNISTISEDFKPMDNLQFVNFMTEKSENLGIRENHEKRNESLHVMNKVTESLPENIVPSVNDSTVIFNAQDIASESAIAKNDNKKEASKRLSDVSDIQDVPPLKSKPPYTESNEQVLDRLTSSEVQLDTNLDSCKQAEVPVNEAEVSGGTMSDTGVTALRKDDPSTVVNVADNASNQVQQKSSVVDSKQKVRRSEIQSIEIKEISLSSDDSMGADNENLFDTAPEEVDPLACTDEDTLRKLGDNEQNEVPAPKMGLRVKPVSELIYDGWKLDSMESPKVSRKRRNSSHESNSEDVRTKQEDESMMGGKRIRLRGKRIPDKQLRKSIEESRVVTISSEDEVVKCSPVKFEGQKIQNVSDDQGTPHSVMFERKTRGRPRGRRRRGYRGNARSTRPKHLQYGSNQVSEVSPEVHLERTLSNNDANLNITPISQKRRKKRKMVLGLEVGRDIAEVHSGLTQDETPVRQSRRIAQLKIKEEADKRRIEDEILVDSKDKKDSTEKKKRKKQKPESEEEVVIKEIETDKKSKRKRRRRKKKKMLAKFNEAHPWRSSSGSSSDEENEVEEEEDEEEEIESEGSLLFKSDHEFSPESDLEKDQESEPLRRARTAQKAQSDVEEADDEYACQKCDKADHPEWILLCDSCDKGWHCSCLRPALMLIPEGDWFCPPCQHNLLVTKLQESLRSYDQLAKRHENEVLRKKRLAFVGISLDNVLHKNESQRQKGSKASSQESESSSASSSSSSSSETSSSEESEPVYQLRERRSANKYKFNDYDAMINAAIQDEVEAIQGAGNQGRGKDIATIVNAKKEEAELQFKSELLSAEETQENKDNMDKKSEKDSDEEYKIEGEDVIDDNDDHKQVVKKFLSRKKPRKLNSLDISSEDDPESDEDFKGTSSEDEEDFDDHVTSSDESTFADTKRRGKRGDSRSVRRSTRARTMRYEEDFIDDDSEESDRPKRKKSRSAWDSDNEDSDNSWRQKKKNKTLSTSRHKTLPKTKSKKKKKRKRIIESDNQSENDESIEGLRIEAQCEAQRQLEVEEPTIPEAVDIKLENATEGNDNIVAHEAKDTRLEGIKSELPQVSIVPLVDELGQQKKKKENITKPKKTTTIRRKIIYGGLPDENKPEEEEILGRRTRGRKINYQEEIATDSEEELKKALRRTGESEDEFIVNEGEDVIEDIDKGSDSGDIYNPKKDGHKSKNKSPKSRKPKKSKSPGVKRKMVSDGTPKQRKKPGPKPGSKNKARKQNFLVGSVIQKKDDQDGEKDIMANVIDNPIGEIDSKIDDNLSENVGLTGTTMSAAGSFTGDVPDGSLTGLGPGELADLDDEQLEQMMMEDEEYGRRQLELAAIEIAKKKKKEEREAKKLEKARLKALEILAAERQRDPNAPEGTDGEVPKKKKRGRRSKAEILAEQMRRDGAPDLNATVLPVSVPQPIASNISPTITPTLSTIMTPEAERSSEGHIPMMTGPDGQLFSPDCSPMKPKRRGRGKGKKTLALEAARAAEAAAKGVVDVSLMGMSTDSNPEMKPGDIPNVLPTPGSSTSGSAPSTPPAGIVTTQGPPSSQTPTSQPVYPSLPPNNQQQSSVITRMLQSQPVSSSPQSFSAAAAAMGHKYFGGPNAASPIMGGPRTGYEMQPRGRIPSPYRQAGQPSMPPHFAAVRSGTPPMRMRVSGPQLYHTPHHPMDPSPSGGGPISINNRDRSSPLGPGPAMIPPAAGSPLAKGGPTPPPPPPYVRGPPPPLSRFADNPMGPRHQIPPFTNASPVNHNMQQPSPPPNRPPGNFSPYHPPPPPNYHYGAYPPPPPMSTADDAAAYQGSPYPADHFSSPADNQPPIQAPPPPQPPPPQQQAHPNDAGAGSKQYDEEGSGEFGGLVSYFSSQREDDLDS
ncbi:uncharacterized protein LOC128872264 isoform X2 [Hylaeus volcanicus]|uniref:uncharacterized protein LOC128872264 isoform X2 n=1 Tax=Hylaeus volcanicus TaxID=313075 RepID=UPI0023B818FD|nr:uncharacterized protein LOC128872264 isoform X2 [Hylaeus volcanicus]